MRSEIKITGDGSSTLFVPELNEHYHSVYGAVQESRHVFIQMGLNALKLKVVSILEVGFGTGLNALLTYLQCHKFKSVSYQAIEKYPLKWEQVEKLKYDEFLGLSEVLRNDFKNMHMLSWDSHATFSNNFSLQKIRIDLRDYKHSGKYNLVYFDAFAPFVQPELWEKTVFEKLFNILRPGGILVTYCAKGEVRRRLERAGYKVERLPGPPGKFEMIRAVRT